MIWKNGSSAPEDQEDNGSTRWRPVWCCAIAPPVSKCVVNRSVHRRRIACLPGNGFSNGWWQSVDGSNRKKRHDGRSWLGRNAGVQGGSGNNCWQRNVTALRKKFYDAHPVYLIDARGRISDG